jgi:hypothetical protein
MLFFSHLIQCSAALIIKSDTGVAEAGSTKSHLIVSPVMRQCIENTVGLKVINLVLLEAQLFGGHITFLRDVHINSMCSNRIVIGPEYNQTMWIVDLRAELPLTSSILFKRRTRGNRPETRLVVGRCAADIKLERLFACHTHGQQSPPYIERVAQCAIRAIIRRHRIVINPLPTEFRVVASVAHVKLCNAPMPGFTYMIHGNGGVVAELLRLRVV